MSAFTVTAVKCVDMSGFIKTAFLTVQGTASYDIGGSILDLSSANAVLAAAGAHFTRVDAVDIVGVEAATAVVNTMWYNRPTSPAGNPATSKLLMMSGGSQASSTTDYSANVYHLRVQGK